MVLDLFLNYFSGVIRVSQDLHGHILKSNPILIESINGESVESVTEYFF